MAVKEPETVVYHHCGDITTDIVCPHCGRWLVEVFSD